MGLYPYLQPSFHSYSPWQLQPFPERIRVSQEHWGPSGLQLYGFLPTGAYSLRWKPLCYPSLLTHGGSSHHWQFVGWRQDRAASHVHLAKLVLGHAKKTNPWSPGIKTHRFESLSRLPGPEIAALSTSTSLLRSGFVLGFLYFPRSPSHPPLFSSIAFISALR